MRSGEKMVTNESNAACRARIFLRSAISPNARSLIENGERDAHVKRAGRTIKYFT